MNKETLEMFKTLTELPVLRVMNTQFEIICVVNLESILMK